MRHDPITSLFIPNRGEIARRLIRTARHMDVRAVVGHSEADRDLPFVAEADWAVCLGAASPASSYLDQEAIIKAALDTGCEAVHPGYGFLSENPAFAEAVIGAGLIWVGPDPSIIAGMGDKIRARESAAEAGLPLSGEIGSALTDADAAVLQAEQIGYPVMLKASAGGGGIGMVKADTERELRSAFESTRSSALRSFGSAAVYLERYISRARHIEVQVLGLNSGRVVTLGERDCSVQRRHQKVVEESPAPGISLGLRDRLAESAVNLAEAIDYRGAGTIEFLVDGESEDFVFLEMNTRLQVEHPVTEMVYGVDLVAEQLRIAAGNPASEAAQNPRCSGSAIEFRIYAEDSVRFFPSPGLIESWVEPRGEGVRVDAGFVEGNTVTPHYDPLLAKLCVHGSTRDEAMTRAIEALHNFHIGGIQTNLDFLRALVEDLGFQTGSYDTTIISQISVRRSAAKQQKE